MYLHVHVHGFEIKKMFTFSQGMWEDLIKSYDRIRNIQKFHSTVNVRNCAKFILDCLKEIRGKNQESSFPSLLFNIVKLN